MIVKLLGHIRHFLRKNKRDNIPAIAAQSSFFIVLSVVPFLMFIFAVLSMISGSGVELYNQLLSESGNSFLSSVLNDAYNRAAGAAVYTIIIALWSSAKGMYAVTDGIKRIYNLPDRHTWLLRRIFSMGYTVTMFVALLVFIIATGVMAFAEDFIKKYIESFHIAVQVLYTLRYLVLFILLVVLMTLALKLFLLRKVSDRRFARFRVLLPGMAVTAFLWVLLSVGTNIYTQYFGGASIYGRIGSVIVGLIWIYFAMYILLCGVQLNYIYRDTFLNFSARNIFRKRKNK